MLLALHELTLFACAVCFGNPEEPLAKGAVAGVGLLLGVVVFLLSAILGVILFWSHRARALEGSS